MHPADVSPFNSSRLTPEGMAVLTYLLLPPSEGGRSIIQIPLGTSYPHRHYTLSIPFTQREGCYHQGLLSCSTLAAVQPKSRDRREASGTRDTAGASRAELLYCRCSNATLGETPHTPRVSAYCVSSEPQYYHGSTLISHALT